MKLKVERRFRDKITGVLHNVGDTFEASDKRAAELLDDKRNLVVQIKEDKKPASQEEPKKEASKAKTTTKTKKSTKK